MRRYFYQADYLLQKIFTSLIFSLPILSIVKKGYFRLRFATPFLDVASNVVITNFDIPNRESGLRVLGHCEINNNCQIDISGGITLGRNVVISSSTIIETHSHVFDGCSMFDKQTTRSSLIIEDEVWIGNNSIITSNVNHIGKGAVIGSGAVVTKNVDSYDVVGGVPARFIRKREPLPGCEG
jgi:acetyltransferase-like isoleucine patch superfamily enzyme